MWIIQSTTYFGNDIYGFKSREKAEKYVEDILNRCDGYSEKISTSNRTTYIENANDEDVYIFKVLVKG